MAQLLGPDGQPIKKQTLVAAQAEPDVSGVRSVWTEPVASNLTPARLGRILRDANDGNIREFLLLAEEMEEREAHYYAVLSTRKRAIVELPITVEAASEEQADIDIADDVRKLVEDPRFRFLISDLTDGLAKGFSAVEIMWEMTGTRWSPKAYEWRQPTFFQFDRRTGQELRLVSPSDPDGDALQPFTFIVHYPRLKSGLPIRGGLARLAVWAWMLKSFTLKDWMAFLEVYGMPFRIGRFGPGATQEEKDMLLRAVMSIAGDAAAIIPKSMEMEFVEAAKSSGTDAFEKKARYIDEQLSKVILGQVSTVDAISGGHAVSKEHNEVRREIVRADARTMEATIQRDLIEAYVAFNHGPQEKYPLLKLVVEEPEDIKLLLETTEKFVEMGGSVSMAEVRDRIGFEDPDPKDTLLKPRGHAKPAEGETGKPPLRAVAQQKPCPSCGEVHTALAREAGDPDELDAIVLDALGDWEKLTDPMLSPILRAVQEASDYEDLRRRLTEAVRDMDSTALVETLARATAKARGLGDVRD